MKDINGIIIDIVEEDSIMSQQKLVDRLRERGLKATQAMISKRLPVIGIVKHDGYYRRLDSVQNLQITPQGRIPTTIIHAAPSAPILKVAYSGKTILVLHTLPGQAQGIADVIDKHIDLHAAGKNTRAWEGLMGCVTGYSTVFVAVENETDLKPIERLIRKRFRVYNPKKTICEEAKELEEEVKKPGLISSRKALLSVLAGRVDTI